MIRLIVYSVAVVCMALLLWVYLGTRQEAKGLAEQETRLIPRPPVSKLYKPGKLILQPGRESPKAKPTLFLPCSKGIHVSHLKAFAVGDVDNDGKKEIIISEGTDAKGSNIVIATRNSTGRFVRPNRMLPMQGDIRSLAVGDVNADGKNEIVAVDFLKSSLTVYTMGITGDFTPGPAYGLPDPRQVMLGDFNQDRLIDVLLYKRIAANKIASVILYQQPSKLLGSADKEFFTYVGLEESVRGVTMADLDGRGVKEMIITHGGKEGVSVTAAALSPPYAARNLFSLSSEFWTGPVPVVASYIDADGRNDLIVGRDGVYAYLQKNDGSFMPTSLISGLERDATVLENGIAAGDVDGNGTDDIIILTRHSLGDYIDILCRVPLAP